MNEPPHQRLFLFCGFFIVQLRVAAARVASVLKQKAKSAFCPIPASPVAAERHPPLFYVENPFVCYNSFDTLGGE